MLQYFFKKKIIKSRKMTLVSKTNQKSYKEEWKIDAEREHKLNSHTRNVY